MTDYAALIDALHAEQQSLHDAVAGIDADAWFAPTPAWGWDVRDTISHLADTDEMAVDTVVGGPHAINAVAAGAASGEDVTYQGVLRGRRRSGAEVLAWWDGTAARERELLLGLDPSQRVQWGIGMAARSFVIARLMETWAHGLDVHAALGRVPADTDRLAHVAWLATRALPYAYSVAGREPPPAPLRVELRLPSGARFEYGPDDAADRITGDASEYCRVFVQRLPRAEAASLHAEGDAADAALTVARAYL